MYTRDIEKTSFGDPEWALEAPNHVLVPPNEVLKDSGWFLSISYGQKPRQQKKVCSNRSIYTRDIAKTSFGAPGEALEAPNHALTPPNEVLQDSEWF